MPDVVLFEGESDRRAFDAAAHVLGVRVPAERVVLGGITNLRSTLAARSSSWRRISALYDVAERRYVVGALAAVGLLPPHGVTGPGGGEGARALPGVAPRSAAPRSAAPGAGSGAEAALEALGFFGCDRDLEDEVIRAAGVDGVLAALDAHAELGLFRAFQGQPAQRDRPVEAQLHRFAGTAAGRKAHFAADVVAALPPDRIPPPLVRLLDALAR